MQIWKWKSIFSLTFFALVGTSTINAEDDATVKFAGCSSRGEVFVNAAECSPYVIPPKTNVNNYNLILILGQDDVLDSPAPIAPTLEGFTDMLGWDEDKIAQYRQKAIDWFLERFGLDFNNGFLDPVTGVLIAPSGDMAMVPILYQGKERVLSSSQKCIPPYSNNYPSSVAIAIYNVVFFTTPVYGGTYANGTPIVGDVADGISYLTYRIFLDYRGNKHVTIFGRNFYPSTEVENRFPTVSPVTNLDRLQLFSPKYGPGYSFVNSRNALAPIGDGFPTNSTAILLFKGTNLTAYDDWNGFIEAPVTP